MSDADFFFDADKEEGSSFSLIPEGRYTAEIVTAKYGPLKSGRGHAVTLTWAISEGDYATRLVFQSLNIQHDSEEAQRIARQQFKDVCVACGITGQITDLDCLLYKPASITVGTRKDSDGKFADRNEVKRVMPFVASWNGPKPKLKEEVLKDATEVKKSFEASKDEPSDSIPF
jgi:hypothetical protein